MRGGALRAGPAAVHDGPGDLGVVPDVQVVRGIELEEERAAAARLVQLPEARGGGEQRAQAAQESTVGRLRPGDDPRAAPALAAQPVEPAVIGDAGVRVRGHGVSGVELHLAQPRPCLEERRVSRGDIHQRGAGVGLGERRVELLEGVVRLCREDGVVTRRWIARRGSDGNDTEAGRLA